MTVELFSEFWNSTYPDTIPISHYFRDDYRDRWFRIHSLPESKRYAASKAEWKILLDRQNEIITDLLGENSKILLVTGDYYSKYHTEMYPLTEVKSIADIDFVSLDYIDLNKLSPDNYDSGQIFRPMFSQQVWQTHKFDGLLKEIADDRVKAFFISIESKCIVAPYDGGINFVLKDEETRDYYREKYNEWLSEREDGL